MLQELLVHFEIFFGRTSPQDFFENIEKPFDSFFTKDNYITYGLPYFSHLSRNELDLYFQHYQQHTQNVFQIISNTANCFLTMTQGEPQCLHQKILPFRKISHRVGQDLLICGYLSGNDQCFREREYFGWKSPVDVDDVLFRSFCQKGLAENHYHLYGSSKLVELLWNLYLQYPSQMNQEEKVYSYFLHPQNSKTGKRLTFEELVLYGAWIRCALFEELQQKKPAKISNFLKEIKEFSAVYQVEEKTEQLRKNYGGVMNFPFSQDNQFPSEDYCLTPLLLRENQNPRFFLTGERWFLYQCLRYLQKTKTEAFSKLFYFYLLLKQEFRAEIVQSNNVVGFDNFALYQKRKDKPWAGSDVYLGLSSLLSVGNTLDSYVDSLELRISPPTSQKKWDDTLNVFKKQMKTEGKSVFFTVHFNKRGDVAYAQNKPRNYTIRENSWKQAEELLLCLERSSFARKSIYGIDSSSNEIGCRPEVFATIFRLLQNYHLYPSITGKRDSPLIPYVPPPQLSATYHVGEDFLDLVDGLRCIDEAMGFLQLKQGSRLGHCLALGLDPITYYQQKQGVIHLPAMELLDNLGWMLKRCPQLDIVIPPLLLSQIQQKATLLLHEIYPHIHGDLFDYVESLGLRGDEPSLYHSDSLEKVTFALSHCQHHLNPLEQFKINPHYLEEDLKIRRKNQRIVSYIHSYHYKEETRTQGAMIQRYEITREYEYLVREIQTKLQLKIADLGYVIECNPSSNQLISTFIHYQNHPIFKFHPLHPEDGIQNIVTVNTDDQGVFDTSLSQEYAILMGTLREMKNNEGRRLYSDDEIFQYLEKIRQAGFLFSFAPKEEKSF